MIDADGVAHVPVEGNGQLFIPICLRPSFLTVNNDHRNQAYIDLNKLPENAEATQSVVQATLTEGAIGYRKFTVISGQKAMAVLRLSDGSHPPFGAEVKNDTRYSGPCR
ncbi:fimbria/pilus outer membrane usher protein [Escherichia coli]